MQITWDVKDGKPVARRYSNAGRFASKREAEEFCKNGRFMYRGRFRTRVEIMEYLRATPAWRYSVIEPRTDGWRFIHPEGAEMFLRAS